MTLTLSDLKHPGASLREVLEDFARSILENIEKLPDDPVVRIHDIRVSTKKIRSLLRLAGAEVSAGECADVVACLREIKDIFAGSRDEDVMRQRLRQIFSGEDAVKVEEKLGLTPSASPPDLTAAYATATAARLSSQLAALNLDGLTPDCLIENAASSYRRARKIMGKCKKSPKDDAMHEWRKRVKDVCYHAMAMSALPAMEELVQPLDDLAESLGEYHDLALLGARAVDHKKIAARVSSAKRKVGKRCFKAAGSIFHPPPRRFAKTLSHAMLSPG